MFKKGDLKKRLGSAKKADLEEKLGLSRKEARKLVKASRRVTAK